MDQSRARQRWTPQRKAALVFDVQVGKRSFEDVAREFGVSELEFAEWARAYDLYGLDGLKVTKPNPQRSR